MKIISNARANPSEDLIKEIIVGNIFSSINKNKFLLSKIGVLNVQMRLCVLLYKSHQRFDGALAAERQYLFAFYKLDVREAVDVILVDLF